MASKHWISTGHMGPVLVLIAVVISISSCVSGAKKQEEAIEPVSAAFMNDALFRNLSDSFSTKELEDAMISLNRTKRQSLNLQQLALLSGLNNANGGASSVATSLGQNTSNGAVKQTTEGKKPFSWY